MPKPTGRENPSVRKLVMALQKKKETFYSDLARYIERPARRGVAVDVSKLPSEDAVVPGKVLGEGKISKAGNVYAISFSKAARDKITKAGGKCIPLQQMVDANKKARIVI